MGWNILAILIAAMLHPEAQPSGRWLVELSPEGSSCLQDWQDQQERESVRIKKLPVGNWVVIEAPSDHLASLSGLSCVAGIYPDRKIEWRTTIPNDPSYINQRDMHLIGMAQAWDISQGGLTAQGDTIVVAVIDEGFQLTHEDLVDNLWYNHQEIPNDGIDNDDNGYTDDFAGINIETGADDHEVDSHGTSVAGIIGGKGNNNKGMAGVNWHIRLMLISGANFESELIESYQYVLDMRKKYRQTNGTSGAFVVATNLSGGINNAMADDHPIWCGMYDMLGEEGILNVCAAPNQGISVDEQGDMPTTCTSEYMIAVTNVDVTDVLLGNAGYGIESIDLAAPGHGTLTTATDNVYKQFPGTSAAAPHVTGVIGLMYSTPCAAFLNGIKTNPSGIAEKVRDILFETAEPNNSLEGLIVTGGRLNAATAMEATVSENCNAQDSSGVKILGISPNPPVSETFVYFESKSDTALTQILVYTVTGALVQEYALSTAEFAQGFVRINTSGFPAGMYMVTIRNRKHKDTVRLFVPG